MQLLPKIHLSSYFQLLFLTFNPFPFPQKIKEGAENEFQRGGAILNPQESKELFEGIIPIRNLHLEIKAELEKLVNDWDGPRTVGDIFLEQVMIVF